MTGACSFAGRLAGDETGATLVEYSILIGLIVVVSIGLIAAVGTWGKTAWSTINSTVTNYAPAS
jgi:pilus assembly protein Flp/PilA